MTTLKLWQLNFGFFACCALAAWSGMASAQSNTLSGTRAKTLLTTPIENECLLIADHTFTQYDGLKLGGRGGAQFAIGGQNASLKADQIIYDRRNEILYAQGHVQMLRKGILSLGACFAFKINSPEYMVTEEHIKVVKLHLRHRGDNSFVPPPPKIEFYRSRDRGKIQDDL